MQQYTLKDFICFPKPVNNVFWFQFIGGGFQVSSFQLILLSIFTSASSAAASVPSCRSSGEPPPSEPVL
jgi:malic enzyme